MLLSALFLAATAQPLVLATTNENLTTTVSSLSLNETDGSDYPILTTLLVALLSVGFVDLLRANTAQVRGVRPNPFTS